MAFGAAIAKTLSASGFSVVIGTRRMDKLQSIAKSIEGQAIRLDVTHINSVTEFCEQIESCDLLVNNAGGAFGLDPIEQSNDKD